MSICIDDSDDETSPPYSRDDSYRSDAEDSKVVQIPGSYTIILSQLGAATLNLRLSHARDQIWVTFEIGENMEKLGYLSLDGITDTASGTRKSPGWRTDDCEAGRLRFGKGCDGWMEFDGNGVVRGSFHSINNGGEVGLEARLEYAFDQETTKECEYEVGEISAAWH